VDEIVDNILLHLDKTDAAHFVYALNLEVAYTTRLLKRLRCRTGSSIRRQMAEPSGTPAFGRFRLTSGEGSHVHETWRCDDGCDGFYVRDYDLLKKIIHLGTKQKQIVKQLDENIIRECFQELWKSFGWNVLYLPTEFFRKYADLIDHGKQRTLARTWKRLGSIPTSLLTLFPEMTNFKFCNDCDEIMSQDKKTWFRTYARDKDICENCFNETCLYCGGIRDAGGEMCKSCIRDDL
jgi:hypothetical protein